VLLLILFLTSCNWSDRCFFDLGSNWFQPRPTVPAQFLPLEDDDDRHAFNETVVDMLNSTAKAAARAAAEEIAVLRNEWTGVGFEWLRNVLGKREWRIDCMDIYVRL
jgi:hypothetical protein